MRNLAGRLLMISMVVCMMALPARASAQTDLSSYAHAGTESYDLYAPTAADVERARPHLDLAAARFSAVLGVAAPKIAVVLTDGTPVRRIDDSILRENGVPVLWWLTDAAWAATHGGDIGDADHSESHILPHEVCHFYLVAYADDILKKSGRTTGAADRSHYGHDELPDWIDEGVAMICENPDMQERRRAWLRQATGERPALATLLTMPNPLSGTLQIRTPAAAAGGASMEPGAAGGGKLEPGTRVGAMTFAAGDISVHRVNAARWFYAQAFSLTEHLATGFGPDALRTFIDGTLHGEQMDTLLAAATGGKATTIAELERNWKATLRK